MKRSGPLSSSEDNLTAKKAKIDVSIDLIDTLPDEMKKEIFPFLNLVDLVTLNSLSKPWYVYIVQFAMDSIKNYFPYLMPIAKEESLKTYIKECQFYLRSFPMIDLRLILSALAGDHNVIAQTHDDSVKTTLYALMVVNNRKLPTFQDEKMMKGIMEKAYIIMSGNGQLSQIKSLLYDGIKINMTNGCTNTIAFTSTNALLNEAWVAAVSRGKQFPLLTPTRHSFKRALNGAASNDASGALEYLFKTIHFTFTEIRDALFVAVEHGSAQAIAIILKQEGTSSQNKLLALRKALRQGNISVFEIIANHCLANIDSAYEYLCRLGFYKAAREFYNEYGLKASNEYINIFIEEAVKSDKLRVVQYIENEWCTSNEELETMLCFAIERKNLDIIKWLILDKINHISVEFLMHYFVGQNLDILQFIISLRGIEIFDDSILAAILCNDLNHLRQFELAQVNIQYKKLCVQTAIHNGNVNVLNETLKRTHLSLTDVKIDDLSPLEHCVRKDKIDMVKYMLASCKWGDELECVLSYALLYDLKEMAALIQQNMDTTKHPIDEALNSSTSILNTYKALSTACVSGPTSVEEELERDTLTPM